MENLGTIFRVSYMPNIPDRLKELLLQYSPEMNQSGGSTAQYSVDEFLDEIITLDLTKVEEKFIQELKNAEINYIEI